jgi:RNA polymerase sigma-70 factor (ECF subfamily)
MPEACRTIFLLRRMDELSLKEIANELHISPKTVENQLTKARKILAQYLRPLLHLFWILLFTQ